jgi:hypothetical protein
LEDHWRDLGRRLLAAHPPASPADPSPPPASPPEPAAGPPAAPAILAGAGPADQPPELLIEHLEVRLVAPAPEPAARPVAPAGARRTWDAAARRYLGRL